MSGKQTLGVVGLGSMGKRRVRDARLEGWAVVGFDIRPDRCAETEHQFGVTVVPSFEALLDQQVDAVVIATPPDQHVCYYERCFNARRPFFSEANILTPRVSWFAERERMSGVRGYPSATWQFHPLNRLLRDHLGSAVTDGAVRTVHHRYAGWLPSWHPWEHYSTFYAGQPLTSAAREMVPFEAELLTWIFGPVHSVCAVRDRRAEWDTAIDDTYLLLLDYANGIRGTLSIELHQVAPVRITRVSARASSFTLDLGRAELDAYDAPSDSWRRLRPPGLRALTSFSFEDVYRAELTSFLHAVAGTGTYDKSWDEDRHLSCILAAAEESWRRRSWVSIEEAEILHDGMTL